MAKKKTSDEPTEKDLSILFERINKNILNFSLVEPYKPLKNVPPYDDSWDIRADFAYEAVFGRGKAYIFYAQGRTSIKKPLVIIEGFDPFNEVNYRTIYSLVNQKYQLADLVRQQGYDLIILDFDKGNDYIQRNAFVLVGLIGKLITVKDKNEKIALIGASMGGLIVRYALAFMESQNIDHQTNLMISFDSPQAGANIPLGLQHFLSYFARYSGAEAIRNQIAYVLDSPASRQMLVYHYNWAGGEGDKAQCDPMRTKLISELNQYKNYPSKNIRKVAIANGSGKGETFYEPHTVLFDWKRLGAWGWFHAMPTYRNEKWEIFRGWYCGDAVWSKHIYHGQPYDGSSGAKRDTIKVVADQLRTMAGGDITNKNDHAFIPTVSALDLQNIDSPNVDVSKLEAEGKIKTPFDRYIYCNKNEDHIFINEDIFKFFKEELKL